MTSLDNKARDIFDDLSNDEIVAVINYARQIFCFSQPSDDTSDYNITTLAVIELRPPAKHKAIKYLDAGGAAPDRKARVVLYRPVFTSCSYISVSYTHLTLPTILRV